MTTLNPFNSILSYFPFITPAVEVHKCEVDRDSLTKRVITISILVFAAIAVTSILAISLSLSPVVASLLIFPCLGLFGLLKLDEWLSERAVDKKAVEEYLQKEKPSVSATAWIQQRARAAEILIHKKANINKINEEGCSLIEALINPLYVNNETFFPLFKLLIENNADLQLKDSYDFSHFERIFQSANPHYLQYVVEQKKIPDNLTAKQKFNCWFYLGHSPITSLKDFKKMGLNYNIKNSKGLTPLVKLIQLDPTLESQQYSRGLSLEAHILTLIGKVSDVEQQVSIEGVSLDIEEFLQRHQERKPIKKLLEQIEKIRAENLKNNHKSYF